MADKKISELTQLTSANAITDVLPVVDSSLDETNKITAANLPISASALARSYPYTRDFTSGIERTRDLSSITNSSGFYYSTNLTSIYIGSNVTSIGTASFRACNNLTSITIPNGVTSISDFTFESCGSLTSATIPDSVTSIGSAAFLSCTSLTSITIPDNVTSIGTFAFESCTSLTSITIPEGVTSIGASAFRDCTSLSRINCLATTPPTLGNGAFSNIAFDTNGFQSIHILASASAAYPSPTFGGLTVVADL